MIVVVTGGRDFSDGAMTYRNIAEFQQQIGLISLLVHGDASGADRIAAQIASDYFGIQTRPVPAEWSNVLAPGAAVRYRNGEPYNVFAGHWRNQSMLDEFKPQWGIVFPGGKGTADMVKRMTAANIPQWIAR